MGGTVYNTLVCFSKLCNEKGEKPYFYGRENSEIHNFFYRESKKYPSVFRHISFSEGRDFHESPEIIFDLETLNISRLIHSWGIDFHPFETTEGMHKFYHKVPNKRIFNKIAEDFYSELGCLENGQRRKNLTK